MKNGALAYIQNKHIDYYDYSESFWRFWLISATATSIRAALLELYALVSTESVSLCLFATILISHRLYNIIIL